ncbi:hypothetical protein PVAP13_5KG013748 [Panicum virgatum]|uniref:Uncharacterized protein n=1 Tax=Panicum virgatum TaxID=38727 RepID=A0A8T0SDY9_PANVG|nr:hypothetical protein PVAP13_5KG013748 [Panicum virgatum]
MYVSIFQGSSQMHAAKMDIGGKLYMFRVLKRLSCWCLQEIGTEILYHHKKRGEWEVAYT